MSGSNCAVLVTLVMLGGALLRLPRLVRAALAVGVLVAFVVLVTPEPSIVRATVMAVIVLVHLAVARPIAGVPVVALAVTGLLVVDPWLARDLAFVLSVLATTGLVVLGGPLTVLLARLVPEPVAAALAVPAAAQLACQPVLLALEPTIALHGVPTNVLAGPAAPLATVGGLVVCVLAPWAPGAAGVVAGVSWLPASWVAAVARAAATWPVTRVDWSPSGLGVAALVGLTALIVVALVARARGRTRAVTAALLVAVVTVTAGVVAGRTLVTRASVPDDWVVAQCDVGQGDAVLVRSGPAVALIDVGDDEAALRRCLSTFGVGRVDLLVLTHFDRDHVGAVDAVVGRVGTVLVGPTGRSDDAAVVTALADAGADVQEARAGTRGRLGELTWRLLWPPPETPAGNDASLVLRVDPGPGCSMGCLSLLDLGDLGETAQRRLVAWSEADDADALARVDVVKVSHHGSADQLAGLYERVAARVGLIGVGADNSYGHPTDTALETVRAAGGVVVRSDEAGEAAVVPVVGADGVIGLRVWSEHASPRAEAGSSAGSAGSVGSSSIGGGAAGRAPVGRRPRGSMAARASGRTAKKSTVAIDQVGWDRIRPASVVLVSGPEQFLADRATRQLRDQLAAEDPSLEVHDLEADHYQPGELVTLASPSLFAEPRLIRVSNVEKCTDAFLTETIRYLETPADDTTVVLRHGGGVRGKKLLDAIRGGTGGGLEVVCAELKKDTEKLEFAAAEFSAERRRISQGALRALVTAFNDDLAELASACQQLISDAAAEITEATVEKYYSGRVETNAFKVADAAIAGQQGQALVLLRHALSTGADPVPVVAAFAMKIRTMAKLQGSYGGSGQLASRFGLAPWQVERAQRDLRGWSEEGLGRCIEVLAETDAAVKGAERDPVYALERMVTMISTRGSLLS
ncbi:DNA polymerase III delta subunit [Frigoribacterium sp. PvP054]